MPPQLTYADLQPGQSVEGFTVEAVYTDARDRVQGARLIHDATGFTFDPLVSATLPQGYIWINTVPVSDRGEPHTQEHLLLGKGNMGRAVATYESMALVQSSAFTQQLRTAYHFHTAAGPEVFYDVLQRRLDALLNPDYSDEEIRREVHHYGVFTDPASGERRLEEKGTIYNEMVSSSQRPWGRLWREMHQALYGVGHPLALSSGGLPEAIREMEPEHIRDFHAATHHLGNMGMIGAFPEGMPPRALLKRVGGALDALQPTPTDADADWPDEADLPPPSPEADRGVRWTAFPARDAGGAAEVVFAWPPSRSMSLADSLLLDLFLDSLAGADNANLYRALVDREARERDVGATGVYAWASSAQGAPVFVGVRGVPAPALDEALATWLRDRLLQEIRALAAMAPEDPALADFNRRVSSALVARARAFKEGTNAPPGFGKRGTGAAWFEMLHHLDREGGERRSLTMAPHFDAARARLAAEGNPWAALIADWGLADDAPLTFVNRPSPEALDALEAERAARLAAETERLVAATGASGEPEALRAFQASYDEATAALDALAAANPAPAFVDDPPMTLDDPLVYREHALAGAPALSAVFDTMTGATVGLALSARAVPADERAMMALLPTLMTEVGVLRGGAPVAWDALLEEIQESILGVSAYWASNPETGRVELIVRAAGADPQEAEAALGFARAFLLSPDWRPDNLARIRDVVDDSLQSLRRRTQGREEAWVQGPASAWRYQDQPLYLSSASFLTQVYDVQRLRWRLMTPSPGASARLEAVAAEGGDREALEALLSGLLGRGEQAPPEGPEAEALAAIAQDLERLLSGVPDESLADDWAALCRAAAADLAAAPGEALAAMERLRARLARASSARLYLVGAAATLEGLTAPAEALVGALEAGPAVVAPGGGAPARGLIGARLAARGAPEAPVYVGFVHPDSTTGVLIQTAPLTGWADTDEESVLRYLAGNAYAGGGAHSLFIKTWGAGLAYSNGARPRATSGTLRYYAERCPEIPETLKFVIGELEAAAIGPEMAEYAVAQTFSSRAAGGYTGRGAQMAADLVDGVGPDAVRAFREAVLAQRSRPDLAAALEARKEAVFGSVLPGYGPPAAGVAGAQSFAIGPERILAGYQDYLGASEGETLTRLYPRDFWIVD